jgi:NADH-quinone oxidoreductase subunit A
MFIGGVTNKLIMTNDNLTIQLMMLVENSIIKKEYLAIFLFLILAILLTVVIITASYFLARQNPESEKLSAYECGFEPYEDARHSFDIRFCLIAILFIIFDIETAYVIPWSVSISKLDLLSFWSMVDFVIELLIGFYYLWITGALDWK